MHFAKKLALFAFATTTIAGTTPAFASTHTATDHDTFWSLAKEYHVSVAALERANPQISPTNIYVGLKINIPTSTNSTPAVLAASTTSSVNSSSAHIMASRAVKMEIDAVASAYTSDGGTVDYFGNKLHFGTVAVDPKVIPLGSTLRIEGMSFDGFPSTFIAKATDEGGAIKGNRIDIYLPVKNSVAYKFGFQTVKVYVLS